MLRWYELSDPARCSFGRVVLQCRGDRDEQIVTVRVPDLRQFLNKIHHHRRALLVGRKGNRFTNDLQAVRDELLVHRVLDVDETLNHRYLQVS